MDIFDAIADVIDLRTFSSVWYWIVLAVFWSLSSHWVIGVPYDMIQRARRRGGQALLDLQDITRVNITRILYIVDEAGPWLLGFVTFLHTVLIVLAMMYRVEIAQGLLFILAPMTLVSFLAVRRARVIAAGLPDGEALIRQLLWQRLLTQGIGIVSIFVTAMYGMLQNLAVTAF